MLGTTIHRRYEVRELLGQGGLGSVFLAKDRLRGATVALKLMAARNEEESQLFRHEFSCLSRIYHPHLCRVFDFGRTLIADQWWLFFTSEYIAGQSLGIHAEGRPWEEVQRALVEGLRALACLHQAGLCHGDLKPDHWMVDEQGRTVLIDLSCSTALGASTARLSGTEGYLAPELLRGQPASERTDLFALGVTLQQLAGAAREPPSAVLQLAERMVAPDASARPAGVAEVLAALGEGPEQRWSLPVSAQLLERSEMETALDELASAFGNGSPLARCLYLHGPEGIGLTRALEHCKWRFQLLCTVVEGDAGRDDAVRSMLQAPPLPPGASPALPHQLSPAQEAGDERVALVLDDVHQLPPSEAERLRAFVAQLTPTSPVVVLLAGRDPHAWRHPAVRPLALQPLSLDGLRQWVGPAMAERELRDLLTKTGGIPGEIQSLHHEATASPCRAELEPELAATLGLCVAAEGILTAELVAGLTLAPETLGRLHAEGWLRREGDRFRLRRLAQLETLSKGLASDLLQQSHLTLARWYGQQEQFVAHEATQWARGGRRQRAERVLRRSQSRWRHDPYPFCAAADALVAGNPTETQRLLGAEIHELAGKPEQALADIETLVPEQLVGPMQLELALRRGSCWLKRGDAAQALSHLALARQQLESLPSVAADREFELLDLECRAHIQQGGYRHASELAGEALRRSPPEPWCGHLHEDLGVSLSYLGRGDEARRHLEEAEGRHRGSPRDEVRTLSYRAILEYRQGQLADAGTYYARALALSEKRGLVDQAISAALNCGTVAHRRGDWGGALEFYERGLALAQGQPKLRAEVALRYNQAQLHCDLGRFDQARLALEQAREQAQRGALAFFVAATAQLEGEISQWEGQLGQARRALTQARRLFQEQGAEREVAEVELQLASVTLEQGEPEEVTPHLEAARHAAQTSGAQDLLWRVSLIHGRLALAQGQPGRALTMLEESYDDARRGNDRELVAEVDLWLGRVYERQGAEHAARRHRQRALETWERCAATLPESLRESYWQHPRRRSASPTTPEPPAQTFAPARLVGLLNINARLNRSLNPRDVLQHTMDAAVELTGAERGFLILASPEGTTSRAKLRVAVARNLDQEHVSRPAMKVSRTIAEQVLATGDPLWSAEAQQDDRFAGTRSIHAMRLLSVLCVPIRGPEGILGALYVDNRFRRGQFEQADLDLLMAFADQAGIALTNARLHDELARKTRQLEAERRKISKLLDERTREVDRLAEKIRHHQQRLPGGPTYPGIVGRSGAMQHVFALVDRVADTPLTILIEGESGTGKELIAQAVHRQSSRRDEAFVSLNCAALPQNLLESELFGYRRGAFTGAERDREGLLVRAGKGTVFLDEVGEMPLEMQVKLLRVLQEKEVRPLGQAQAVPIHARILCATNRNLRAEVEAGRFREDLYYRLAVVVVTLPPLRDRLEDLPELVHYLVQRRAEELGHLAPSLSSAAIRRLAGHDWPGNVRQLENVLSQALLFATGDTIESHDIVLPPPSRSKPCTSFESYQTKEAQEIAAALEATRWNITEVSRLLGIPRTSLYRKLKTLGLSRRK
jgi:transcriptional regulator with GAF, ATPase, and Fis domain